MIVNLTNDPRRRSKQDLRSEETFQEFVLGVLAELWNFPCLIVYLPEMSFLPWGSGNTHQKEVNYTLFC